MEGDTLELLASIRQNAFIPAAQSTFTDVQTLASATGQLRGYILPKLMSRRGEFYAGAPARVSVPVLEGVDTYRIPTRAVGAKVRSARLLDPLGNPTHLNTYELEEVQRWPTTSPGTPHGLTIEGGSIRLYPKPQGLAGWVLEISTFLRPAALITPNMAMEIVGTEATTSGTTDVLFPTGTAPIFGFLAPERYDVVEASSPFETRAADVSVLDVDDDGVYLRVEVSGVFSAPAGSWLCVSGTAPVVQLPLEWHPMLVLKTAASQLSSLGDMAMAAAKLKELEGFEENSGPLVTPRRDDAARKVKNGMNKWRTGGAW